MKQQIARISPGQHHLPVPIFTPHSCLLFDFASKQLSLNHVIFRRMWRHILRSNYRTYRKQCSRQPARMTWRDVIAPPDENQLCFRWHLSQWSVIHNSTSHDCSPSRVPACMCVSKRWPNVTVYNTDQEEFRLPSCRHLQPRSMDEFIFRQSKTNLRRLLSAAWRICWCTWSRSETRGRLSIGWSSISGRSSELMTFDVSRVLLRLWVSVCSIAAVQWRHQATKHRTFKSWIDLLHDQRYIQLSTWLHWRLEHDRYGHVLHSSTSGMTSPRLDWHWAETIANEAISPLTKANNRFLYWRRLVCSLTRSFPPMCETTCMTRRIWPPVFLIEGQWPYLTLRAVLVNYIDNMIKY